MDLYVKNIPNSLKDDEGNSKISFRFADNPISGDESTDLIMEVLQPIDESLSPTITVRSEAPSGSVDTGPKNQEETFQLNTDAFSPRTIEEF
ncbi:hypothetical protein [Fodinibius halophilus]|uniref:Uncharacterized protein n=1 Tax=Fodinibius halophilus TaxID=1736908 RepID=A0A6M1T6Z0_9BACT|nr:hypothetical protein [Fodinibius halophilus]NGP86964.1 hypothetical protein [Fodinibius halophilus]